ncbi:MAG: hypothetical protein Q9160_005203 [Pyrenula sp. 1 TL-2023]
MDVKRLSLLYNEKSLLSLCDVGPGVKRRLKLFRAAQTQRFYQAVTGLWVQIEALRLMSISRYKRASQRNVRFEEVRDLWQDNKIRCLQESLDMLEVYDFIYGFILRKILHPADSYPSWAEQKHGAGRYLRAHVPPRASLHEGWYKFVIDARMCLRPSHIIELFALHKWNTSGSWPVNKTVYLRTTGFYDELKGVYKIEDVGTSPDTLNGVESIEDGIFNRLLSVTNGQFDEKTWKCYREKCWASDARGSVFEWDSPEQKIIRRISDSVKATTEWEASMAPIRVDGFLPAWLSSEAFPAR